MLARRRHTHCACSHSPARTVSKVSSTENATPIKSTNSNVLIQIEVCSKSQFELSLMRPQYSLIAHSSQNAEPPKSTKPTNSNFSIQFPIQPKSQFGFVPRDTEESEFLNTEDFGDVAFLVESVKEYFITKALTFEHIYRCDFDCPPVCDRDLEVLISQICDST